MLPSKLNFPRPVCGRHVLLCGQGWLTPTRSVIVATGLMVLVDDCIRQRWHSDKSPPLARPMRHSISRGVELIGPKRLIDEVFHRRGSA